MILRVVFLHNAGWFWVELKWCVTGRVIGIYQGDLKVKFYLGFIQRLGLLRAALLLLACLVAVSMLWVDTSLAPEGWGLLRAAVLPALPPIVFMVLLLDILMCQILKSDEEISTERRLNLMFVTKCHLFVATILLLSWLPVFISATYF